MKLRLFSMLALALPLIASFSISAAPMPRVGDKAPVVEGKNENGKTWKLANDVGKKVVLLYFYPKDDTPTCTKEACGFRDNLDQLKKQNVEVIGVSFDTAESHKEFKEKYNLNFPLIVDNDGKIADAYGVRTAGKEVARRVSFLIGLDGKIVHVTDSPRAEVHLSEMKEAVAKLKKG